jgi:hypothetical protein
MADQELGIKVKTTSDVPEAMGKAKSAVVSFEKQVDDIKKKFSTSFKDIFLSIAGPMAIFGILTNTVTSYLEKIKKAQEDTNKAAIDGVNERMAAEDVFYARKIELIKKEKLNQQQAKDQPKTTAFEFLMNDPRAKSLFGIDANSKIPAFGVGGMTAEEQRAEFMSTSPKVQEQIRKILAEDMAKEGITGKGLKAGQSSPFKGPEGFGNVIGVGPNPVLEAQAAQLEESKKQTVLLQNLVDRNPFMPTDFTKTPQSK